MVNIFRVTCKNEYSRNILNTNKLGRFHSDIIDEIQTLGKDANTKQDLIKEQVPLKRQAVLATAIQSGN